MATSGRSVNQTTLFLGKLRPHKRLFSTKCTYCRPSCLSGRRNESMWPDQVSYHGPLAFESDALRGQAFVIGQLRSVYIFGILSCQIFKTLYTDSFNILMVIGTKYPCCNKFVAL